MTGCSLITERVHRWHVAVLHHKTHPHPLPDTLTCINGGDTSHGYGGGGNYTPVYGGGWSASGGAGFIAGETPWISGGHGTGSVVVLPGVIEIDVGQPFTPVHGVPEPATLGMLALGLGAAIAVHRMGEFQVMKLWKWAVGVLLVALMAAAAVGLVWVGIAGGFAK